MKKQFNTRAILASLLICGFVGMFSETALNIAMTNLMDVFQISAATAQWLTTGFLLTLGILMPMSGLLLQRFTTRQLFTGSLISLIMGTLIAALAFYRRQVWGYCSRSCSIHFLSYTRRKSGGRRWASLDLLLCLRQQPARP